LGLTDESGTPTDDLIRFVTVPDGRKEVIRQIWQRLYAEVFAALDVSRSTADQLSEAFGQYAMVGDTKARAMIFFVHGAKFAEIPISNRIVEGVTRVKIAGTRKPKRARAGTDTTPAHGEDSSQPPARQPAKGEAVAVGVHPMLQGAIVWLAENGPRWTVEQADAWCQGFVSNVKLVYPAKRIRAKDAPADA
jgi:hypothetical protein